MGSTFDKQSSSSRAPNKRRLCENLFWCLHPIAYCCRVNRLHPPIFSRAYQEVLGGVLLYTLMMFSPVAASQMMFVVLTLRISVGSCLDRKMRIHTYMYTSTSFVWLRVVATHETTCNKHSDQAGLTLIQIWSSWLDFNPIVIKLVWL